MNTLEKNQILELQITALSNEGLGIARYNGIVVFVSGGVPEDTLMVRIVKVMKTHGFGIIEDIIKPSVYRIENDCPVFPQCGGCKLRQFSYDKELSEKNSFVAENLKRIGKADIELEQAISSPLKDRYRNKAQYPIAIVDGEPKIGFFASRSHRIIPIEDCLLQPEIFSKIAKIICNFIKEHNISVYNEETGKGLLRHICLRNADSGIMVTLVINGQDLPHWKKFVETLKSEVAEFETLTLSHNTKKTNVIMGKTEKILYGSGFISDNLCGVELQLSSNSFYQVNKKATELLYAKVAEYADIKSNELVLDLYCGIGSIGLSLADKARQVIGVEIIQQAIYDAAKNAERNNITNTRFICADAGEASNKLEKEGLLPDVIIIDPPRKGVDDLTVNSVVAMNPKRIVYVSCNSSTLARDVNIFETKGYKVTKGVAVDMFPRTVHIESVVLLKRN